MTDATLRTAADSRARKRFLVRAVRLSARKALWTIVAALFVPFFAAPLVWMVSSALKYESQVFAVPIQWIPSPVVWSNFTGTLQYFPFVQELINTLIITGSVVVGTMACSALVGYGLARIEWPGRNLVFYMALATMLLPAYVTVIPLFAMFSQIGWVDTFYPLIFPTFLGANGFFIFLMRQFLLRHPRDLYDAARVDGANHIYMFLRICMPMAKPALAVVALFSFIWTWTDFFLPLVYLSTPSKFTLMLGLQYLHGQHTIMWPYLMMANALIVLPIMFVFLFAQRTFVQGIHLTGMR